MHGAWNSIDSRRPGLVIVADDLTGAADTAGAFASHGFRTALSLDQQPRGQVDVLSLTTDCRDAPCEEVPVRVRSAIARGEGLGEPALWFHKVDSAFRGHPGLELSVLTAELNRPNVVVCPALPSQGRTVVDGHIYVGGVLLHETALAEGKATSEIAAILAPHLPGPIASISLADVRAGTESLDDALRGGFPGVVVPDAETDEDLRAIASVVGALANVLPAGSAGLAAAVSGLQAGATDSSEQPAFASSSKPVLLVVGSAHPASSEQVEVASRLGAEVIRPGQVVRAWTADERIELASRIERSIRAGRNTIVTLADCPRSPLEPHVLANQLADVSVGPIVDSAISGLVMTGGDIAAAVCRRIGAGYLWLYGEVSPAVPWGSIGSGPAGGMPVVTKAGSFGSPAVLSDAIDLIERVTQRQSGR